MQLFTLPALIKGKRGRINGSLDKSTSSRFGDRAQVRELYFIKESGYNIMKRYLYYCPKCKKITLMTLIKEDKNKNTTFLKCVVCSASEVKKKSDSDVESMMARKDGVRVYNPKDSYRVGDSVYHKTFDDTGEVVKVTKRFNGQVINTIIFPAAGIKKLVTLPDKKIQSM